MSLCVISGWAGETMNYSVNSQACTSLSLNNSDSDVNSDTEENESGMKDLNTTCVELIALCLAPMNSQKTSL